MAVASGASPSTSSVKAESELRGRLYLSGGPLRAGPAPQPPVWRRVSALGTEANTGTSRRQLKRSRPGQASDECTAARRTPGGARGLWQERDSISSSISGNSPPRQSANVRPAGGRHISRNNARER